MVVVVSKPLQPTTSTGLTANPKRMEAVDSNRNRLEPFFNVVPLSVIEMTAQIVSKQSSQIPATVYQKFGV